MTMSLKSKKYGEVLKMCMSQLDLVKNNRRHYFNQGELQSLKSQIEILNDLVNSIKTCIIEPKITLKATVEEKLFHQFDFMLEKIEKRHSKFSAHETGDFNRECKRFYRACQLAVIENSSNFPYSLTKRSVKVYYENACSILQSIQVYSDTKEDNLKIIIEILKKEVENTSLTDRERKEIVQAIGLSQGHWFKCPNGHIYCIGECGGAMQQSKCPECGEAIGGSNHHLLSTNRLASEMDGAQRHAFPGGLY